MHILLTVILIPSITCSMFVFWGIPEDTDQCVPSDSSSFDDCVAACVTSETCMLVFGNDDSCQSCDLYSVSKITSSTNESGIKTAIKVDEPGDGCPNSMLTEYTRTDIVGGYTLSYSDSEWTITGSRCLVGWRMFDRQENGLFCLSVIVTEQPLSRYDGNGTCTSTYSAVLAGPDSLDEKQYIMESARTKVGSRLEYQYTRIWLGGGKKGSCSGINTGSCAGINGFDSFIYQSNFEAYNFASGYPTNNLDGGMRQNCLALMMKQSSTSWDGLITNAVSVAVLRALRITSYRCTTGCNSAGTICALAFLCGVPATQP